MVGNWGINVRALIVTLTSTQGKEKSVKVLVYGSMPVTRSLKWLRSYFLTCYKSTWFCHFWEHRFYSNSRTRNGFRSWFFYFLAMWTYMGYLMLFTVSSSIKWESYQYPFHLYLIELLWGLKEKTVKTWKLLCTKTDTDLRINKYSCHISQDAFSCKWLNQKRVYWPA